MKLIVENDLHKMELLKEAYDPTKPQTIKLRGVFGKLDFNEASIDEIVAIRNEAESLIGQGGAGIDNILGEFCETCDSITYKLKRLL